MALAPSQLTAVSLGLILSVTTLSGSQAKKADVGSSRLRATRFPVEETTIAQLHAAYLQRKVTVREVTQSYIDRIAAYDKRGPYLNSIITLNNHALEEADRLDAALVATGRLTGHRSRLDFPSEVRRQ